LQKSRTGLWVLGVWATLSPADKPIVLRINMKEVAIDFQGSEIVFMIGGNPTNMHSWDSQTALNKVYIAANNLQIKQLPV
jgi:hypothetical protein